MCLWGFVDIAPHFGAEIPTKHQFWGVNRRFQAKRAKHFCIYLNIYEFYWILNFRVLNSQSMITVQSASKRILKIGEYLSFFIGRRCPRRLAKRPGRRRVVLYEFAEALYGRLSPAFSSPWSAVEAQLPETVGVTYCTADERPFGRGAVASQSSSSLSWPFLEWPKQ